MYYGRKGEPLGLLEWAARKEDREYSRVDYTELPPTSKYPASYLSTVWIGLDMQLWPPGPPFIFETMRFESKLSHHSGDLEFDYHKSIEFPDPDDAPGEYVEQLRYSTEEQASLAHRKIVRLIQEQEMT